MVHAPAVAAADAAAIEAQLRAHSFPLLEGHLPPGEFVMPHYGGLGLANLPATMAALLGAELPGDCPPLRQELWADWRDGLRRIVLVIVDALGYLQLRAAMSQDADLAYHRLAEAGRMVPLASTFPSTTNAVLTTLWTGRSPAAHGILAYELYLRELGIAASTLFFWPVHYRRRDSLREWGIAPDRFVPAPGLAEQLAAQGISTYALISKAYADSLLSQIHVRGAKSVHGFVTGSDMWIAMQRILEQHPAEKMLLVAYWDTVDGITHQRGPDDEAWDLEVSNTSWLLDRGFLSRLTRAQRKGTLLLVTADHGGIATPPRSAVRLEDHPLLHATLSLPPLGESRAPFLHTRGDALAAAEAYLRGSLSSAFVTLAGEQVLNSGLLGPGPVYEETPHRLGDLVCLARGSRYLARDDAQLKTVGRHGGLSPQEMLVPLIGVRLDGLP